MSSPSLDTSAPCPSCRAPLASDQRYCLECGERRMPQSEFLRASSPVRGDGRETLAQAPSSPSLPPEPSVQRTSTLTVIAGVGVLLLAMGVGVLIGRSGSGKSGAAPAQVISVASAPSSAGSGATAAAEATFTGDWPSGTNGYTVELQTLPQTGTAVSAVEAAKATATAKGAKGVGALKSEEFTSLSAGSYVIYAGVEQTKSAAEKELPSLRSFPGAKVIKVSNGGSASSQTSGSSSPSKVPPSSESHPAPPSVLETLKNTKGKSYEEKSKNLPNVVSTG